MSIISETDAISFRDVIHRKCMAVLYWFTHMMLEGDYELEEWKESICAHQLPDRSDGRSARSVVGGICIVGFLYKCIKEQEALCCHLQSPL